MPRELCSRIHPFQVQRHGNEPLQYNISVALMHIFECNSVALVFHSIQYLQSDVALVMHIHICSVIIEIQKLSSMLKVVKDPKYHYDDVEMESHNLPKSHSKSTAEPQYEECGGGVTSSNVAMEDNPAYQSVDLAAAKP